VPGLDDDFAQMASEFDTLGELRADTRTQLERDKAMRQVMQARDLALDALLDRWTSRCRRACGRRGRPQPGVDRGSSPGRRQPGWLLEMTNQTEEQFEADLEQRAQRAVKISLVLDQLAGTRNSASTRPS